MNKYYVYVHVDPKSKKVIYVGKGCGGRAWAFAGRRKTSTYSVRWHEHFKYLNKLVKEGYLPSDWVKIINRNLTNKQALSLEKSLIDKLTPIFNRSISASLITLSKSQIRKAIQLRKKGEYYSTIAKKLNKSTMTIYRAINGQTKGYRKFLNVR